MREGPILASMSVESYGADSAAVVDATDLFLSNIPELGPVELGGWDHALVFSNPPPHLLEAEVAPHYDEWFAAGIVPADALEPPGGSPLDERELAMARQLTESLKGERQTTASQRIVGAALERLGAPGEVSGRSVAARRPQGPASALRAGGGDRSRV